MAYPNKDEVRSRQKVASKLALNDSTDTSQITLRTDESLQPISCARPTNNRK